MRYNNDRIYYLDFYLEENIGEDMLIGNLDHGTAVTIHVTDGVKAVQLNSQVVELSSTDRQVCLEKANSLDYQSFIVIKVIKAGERILNFSSENISCTITALSHKKPYSWKDVKIVALALPEQGMIHMVLSNDDMNTFNRRNEYRLFLGQEGSCRFGDSKESRKVLIKDVSCSGVGMVISKGDNIKINAGMEAEVQFQDSDSDGNMQKYTLNGKIVRFVAMGNGKELIGCRLSGRHPELEKMIYEKQRRNMSTDYKIQVKRETTRNLAKQFAELAEQNQEDSVAMEEEEEE